MLVLVLVPVLVWGRVRALVWGRVRAPVLVLAPVLALELALVPELVPVWHTPGVELALPPAGLTLQ